MIASFVRSVLMYGAIMAIVTFAAPDVWHSWDWDALRAMTGVQPITPNPAVVLLNPTAYDLENVTPLRTTLANFLDAEARIPTRSLRPTAIVLDFSFGTQDRDAPGTAHFLKSIAAAKGLVDLYTTKNPPVDDQQGDDSRKVGEIDQFKAYFDSLDQRLYSAIPSGHTTFAPVIGADVVTYESCLRYPTKDGPQSVSALPAMLAAGPNDVVPCDPPIRNILPIGPNPRFPSYPLGIDGKFAAASLGGKIVVIGSVKEDVKDQIAGVSNPEILAWAIGAASHGSGLDDSSQGPTSKSVTPLQTPLVFVVLAIALVTALVFVAALTLLSQIRFKDRRAQPWLAAAIAGAGTLGLFAALEYFLALHGSNYPQVSLPAISVLVCCLGSALWGRDALRKEPSPFERVYDWDVFLSYAHEEKDWVKTHVLAPLEAARVNGRPLNIFYDDNTIEVSEIWMEKIALSIDGSRYFLPVYSDVYFTRPYCLWELRLAQGRRLSEKDPIVVCPLARGTPAVPSAYRDIQFVNYDRDPEAVRKIVDTIARALEAVENAAKAKASTTPSSGA